MRPDKRGDGRIKQARFADLYHPAAQLEDRKQANSAWSRIDGQSPPMPKDLGEIAVPGMHIEARKFLDSLQYEARFATS